MGVVYQVQGFEELQKRTKELNDIDATAPINVYFMGSKNSSGKSWCPDCNRAEPLVFEALSKVAPSNAILLCVDVGDRAFWVDKSNIFRKSLDLVCIPTLLKWNNPKRLVGDECENSNLLEKFFAEQ